MFLFPITPLIASEMAYFSHFGVVLKYFAPVFSNRRNKFEHENQFETNCNRKLLISRAPTKAKSQEPAYSQALNQNKVDRQRSRSRESGRQTIRRLWVDGAWS